VSVRREKTFRPADWGIRLRVWLRVWRQQAPAICNKVALLATGAAAVCYALSGGRHNLLLWAAALTLTRAALNIAAGLLTHRPLTDRYSDMFLMVGIFVAALTGRVWPDIIWPSIAIGSMLLAVATGMLARVPGLDGRPFGPTGVIARLVCLIAATIWHWVFLTGRHTPWQINGQPLEPLAIGTALVALLAQLTVLGRVVVFLRRTRQLRARVDTVMDRRPGAGVFAANEPDESPAGEPPVSS